MVKNNPNKHGITLRGDRLYCPLPLSLEPYWSCSPDCLHCWFRNMNHVWGNDLRPINLNAFEIKLKNGLKNKYPQSDLAYCLKQKKTFRIGNKSDPFQPIERKYIRSTGAMFILRKLNWSFVVQTKFTDILMEMAESSIIKANRKQLIIVLVMMSPGLEKDWELFERKKTTDIPTRIKNMKQWNKQKISMGVNGEPFIPGHHTIQDFENTMRLLCSIGVKSYNTYSFHFTPFVAKRIVDLPGVDIEKIWYENQDFRWKKILVKLIEIAKKYNIKLGCPDFVNSGKNYIEPANTCCGIDVPNPCTYNTHFFKKYAQQGLNSEEIQKKCFDHSANGEQGLKIIKGEKSGFYTLKDAGIKL